MKILFICGSLEYGKDGVGDYTRRLACELIKQGNSCAIVALMDKFLSNALEEYQQADNNQVKVLRLPYQSGYKVNCKLAKPFIDTQEADWVSLQYVPFAFDKRGLHWGFSKHFKLLTQNKNTKIHIMFHELWVGMNIEAPFKLKLWGLIQKEIIISFIRYVKPSICNTHAYLYKFKLTPFILPVFVLPLFSNISRVTSFSNSNLTKKFTLCVFGHIHFGAPILCLAAELKTFIEKQKIEAEVVFIGKNGVEQQIWKDAFDKHNINTVLLNEQNEETISIILQSANIGISSTPYLLYQKSGTIAAMLQHCLPVLIVARPWNIKNFKAKLKKNIIEYKSGIMIHVLSDLNKYTSLEYVTIEEIANKLVTKFKQ